MSMEHKCPIVWDLEQAAQLILRTHWDHTSLLLYCISVGSYCKRSFFADHRYNVLSQISTFWAKNFRANTGKVVGDTLRSCMCESRSTVWQDKKTKTCCRNQPFFFPNIQIQLIQNCKSITAEINQVSRTYEGIGMDISEWGMKIVANSKSSIFDIWKVKIGSYELAGQEVQPNGDGIFWPPLSSFSLLQLVPDTRQPRYLGLTK